MPHALICPKCKIAMTVITQGTLETDECPRCGGVWVDVGEEKQALHIKPEVFTVDELRRLRKLYTPPQNYKQETGYAPCPRCGKLMWRKIYMRHSGIIVDKCGDHGTFFDKGELEKAVEFIKKGGIEYEKLRLAETGIAETQAKLVKEISKVETQMYRLHWIGRFLSLMGF
jgi:Zn-finger nucleic acid-binding protein